MRHALKTLAAGSVLYLVMAACSAVGSSSPPTSSNDGGETTATDPIPAAKAESGSRLKARSYVGSDGSKQFAGWYDTARKEDCDFAKAADGKARCLPPGAGVLPTVFGDSGCTKPLAYVFKGCSDVPKYGRSLSPTTCYAAATISKIAGAHSGATFTGTPASCTDAAGVAASYDLYDLGPEVSPSDFVEASVKVDP
jgi:hypothetical protein